MEKYIFKAQKHCKRKISIFIMALGSMKKKYTSPLATGKQVLQADEVSSAVSTTVYSLIYNGINNKISITNKGEDVLSSSVFVYSSYVK